MRKTLWISLLTVGIFSVWALQSVAQVGNQPVSGDVNGDGKLDINDPITLLNHLFVGGPPPVACAADEGISVDLLMAGTFILVNDGGGGATVQRHGDGTFSASTSDRFAVELEGLGTVNLGRLLGSWRAEGETDFRYVGIQFARAVADDRIVGFVRYEGNGHYAADYDSYELESTLSVYGADRDPLDPGPAPPLQRAEARSTAMRLAVP